MVKGEPARVPNDGARRERGNTEQPVNPPNRRHNPRPRTPSDIEAEQELVGDDEEGDVAQQPNTQAVNANPNVAIVCPSARVGPHFLMSTLAA